MKISLLGRQVVSARLFNNERIYGRRLAGTDILVIIDSKYAGQFAVPRWREYYASGRVKELRYQLVPNLYLVFRQAIEILYRYGQVFEGGEREKMWAAIQAAQDLNEAVLRPKEEKLESLERQLDQRVGVILAGIGRVKNPAKKRAVTRLSQVSTLYDSLDRINPGAKKATVLAARRDLQSRLYSEMAFIEPKIAMRLWAAGKALDFAEYILADARHYLAAIEKYLGGHQRISGYAAERMISRLVYITENLSLLDFQPFVANYRLSACELEKASDKIRSGELREAEKLIRRANQSLKMKALQRKIEDLLLKISLDLLNKKKISDNDAASYAIVIGIMRHYLDHIDEREFKRPVKKQAKLLLLVAGKELTAGQLKKGKELLRQASDALTWD